MFYLKALSLQNKRKKKSRMKKCKYPHGDVGTKSFRFCCEPITNDRFVYCDEHAKICYTNFEQIKNLPRKVSTDRRK